MNGYVRRIVTGHDANGKAVISSDGAAPAVIANPRRPGYFLTQLWATHECPAIVGNTDDPTASPLPLAPPQHGSVVRIIEFPPEHESLSKFDRENAEAAFAAIGGKEHSTYQPGARHPMMHRTESVDYGIVLEGEIVLVLDDTETTVRAGEVVVQRGTNHAWSNRSNKPCKMAFILLDGIFAAELA
jgi:mannose-6-phosphate isomerase-like protein (cupin superfamily)